MVHEDSLSAVLSDFARTMLTDFPIQGILDHLVERIVEVLPVTAAGVTLISAGMAPQYIAASDDDALRFERLQTDLGEGPCLTAYQSGEAVAVPDLRTDDRFPRFSRRRWQPGLAAVFTFPLRHGDGRLGALDLYRDTAGELDPRDMDVAQTLADVAAAYLLNAQARDEAREASGPVPGQRLARPADRAAEPAAAAAAARARRPARRALAHQRRGPVRRPRPVQAGQRHLRPPGRRRAADRGRPAAVGLVRPGRHPGPRLRRRVRVPVRGPRTARRTSRSSPSGSTPPSPHPFELAGIELTITASVGMAFAGPGEDISNQLVVDADTAMYQAKRKGGAAHQVIDLREASDANDRDSLEMDLRQALAKNELDVAYQPIVRSADGRVTGVEALLRWTHPTRGAVPAISLVGVAEQSGLISDIGAWVLERSCHDRGRWLHDHPDMPLDLAVNVSGRQLMGPDFAATVAVVLALTGMDPAALVLEMTEDIFIEDSERAMTVLAELKGLGVRLALDDFGTGYSSLSYLRRLPDRHRQDRPELHRRHRAGARGQRYRRGRDGACPRPRPRRHRRGSGDADAARPGERHRLRVCPGLLLRATHVPPTLASNQAGAPG